MQLRGLWGQGGQAAGAWERLPPGLCTETGGWLGRQCPRWPLAQAQWTPNPIPERGSRTGKAKRHGKEGGVGFVPPRLWKILEHIYMKSLDLGV